MLPPQAPPTLKKTSSPLRSWRRRSLIRQRSANFPNAGSPRATPTPPPIAALTAEHESGWAGRGPRWRCSRRLPGRAGSHPVMCEPPGTAAQEASDDGADRSGPSTSRAVGDAGRCAITAAGQGGSPANGRRGSRGSSSPPRSGNHLHTSAALCARRAERAEQHDQQQGGRLRRGRPKGVSGAWNSWAGR